LDVGGPVKDDAISRDHATLGNVPQRSNCIFKTQLLDLGPSRVFEISI